MNQNFRFNNPKQCSNWIILASFCSSHLAIKNCYNVILGKFKNRLKNSKKFVYYNENMYTNSKFQTQLSRKLQRFRTCRKNNIFHELSEYQQKWQLFLPLDWSFKLFKFYL